MKQFKKLVVPYIIWSAVFVVFPLVLIFLYAVTTGGNSLVNIKFTWDSFQKMAEPIYVSVFLRSLKLGVITTIICLGLGYPLAYMISKCREQVQVILILFITIPMWINTLLRTYAWISILQDNGLLNSLLEWLGFGKLHFMYTDVAVVMGLVCDLLPFMIIPIHTVLTKMDHSLIEAAQDLGADKWQVFGKVIFKMSIPGVLNGVTMVFLLAISAFVIPKLLGGAQYFLIGNLIEDQFLNVGNWNFGSAISIILALAILLIINLMRKVDSDGAGGDEE